MDKDFSPITQQNRRAWNEIADVRAARWAEKLPTDELRTAENLPSEVRAALGDVSAKRVLHLQCATGEESIALAALGARVTAVDIADRQIELARQRAVDAGLDVAFVAADVYALPSHLQATNFDVVYTGGGVMTWLPDLVRWAKIVERALAPGGRFVLVDEHPVAQTLSVEDGRIVMSDDYFQCGRVVEGEPGWTHFNDRGQATEPKYEFVWGLGEVVTTIAATGLVIERLNEYPTSVEDQEWRYRGAVANAIGLPGMFLLVARK